MNQELTVNTTDEPDIDEGQHEATIVGLTKSPNEGEDMPPYLNVEVKVEEIDYNMSFGVPLNDEITPRSYLGKLIDLMDEDGFQPNKEYNLGELLVDKKILVEVRENDEGFPNIVTSIDSDFAISRP